MSRKRQAFIRYSEEVGPDAALNQEIRERKAKRLALSATDVTTMPFFGHLHTTADNYVTAVPGQADVTAVKREPVDQSATADDKLDSDVTDVSSPARVSVGEEFLRPAVGNSAASSCDDVAHVTEVNGVRVILEDLELWQTFYKCGTEMIINRPGRRMFPSVVVSIAGLNPSSVYKITLDIVPADDRRYKYVNNKWTAVGKADPEINNPPYVHPDSPSTGKLWMQTKVSFSKIKITNNKESEEGNVLIHSMHKYLSQVTIVLMRNGEEDDQARYVFPLPLTTFIAVTAYQSENIVQMKIRNNPFAKAFRDGDLSGMLHHQSVDGLMGGCLTKRDRDQELAGIRKPAVSRRHTDGLHPAMTLTSGFQSLVAPNSNFALDYPAIVNVSPYTSIVRPELVAYYDGANNNNNIAGAVVATPGVGLQNLALLNRNEATYRWLCACSQNLSAQAQTIRMRALAMMGQTSTSGLEGYRLHNLPEVSTAPKRSERHAECSRKDSH